MRRRPIFILMCHIRKTRRANSDCEAPQKTRKNGRGFPNVARPELKVRGRPFFIPTLYVRKTGKCHRGAWKAGWEIPNIIRPELKVRGRPFFFLTLHVGKTRMCHRSAYRAGWEFPNVTRPELKVRGMPFFILTLHVGKTREGPAGLSKVRRRSHQSAQTGSLLRGRS